MIIARDNCDVDSMPEQAITVKRFYQISLVRKVKYFLIVENESSD